MLPASQLLFKVRQVDESPKVYDQRRKVDYADFMQLVSQYWSDAKILRLIQDNLNTHKKGSFYDKFDAQTAFELANRFEFHFTPLKGSWLNAVEKFSATPSLKTRNIHSKY